jgi:hypothetical protein
MSNIIGYRDLSEDDKAQINTIKEVAEEVGTLVALAKASPHLDQRWVSIAATQLQQGFMALVRAVAQPTTF